METILNFAAGCDNVQAGEGRSLEINGVEAVFRYCPPGTFMMGASEGEEKEKGRSWRIWYNETRHQVTLTRGFWTLETPVTQRLWQAVMGANPSYFRGDSRPVECVSWYDCQDFVKKLNALNLAPRGLKFSLPTEAQWEYACRAGTTSPFPWDKNIKEDMMLCGESKPYKGTDELEDKTLPVGLYPPNPWGLYDMCGNVGEWSLDMYADYRFEELVDPLVDKECKCSFDGCVCQSETCCSRNAAHWDNGRVVRGGDYSAEAKDCCSSARGDEDPRRRENNKGVRLFLVERPEVEEPQAGDGRVIEINGVEKVFRYCPSGTFKMGEKSSDDFRRDMRPEVILTRDFWILETLVTQDLWQAVMGKNPKWIEGDDGIVDNVSWYECQEFIERLNSLKVAPNGFKFALPTEAQWEYACRAGYGDNCERLRVNTIIINRRGRYVETVNYLPNAWNLYDMFADVCEWCQDACVEYSKKTKNLSLEDLLLSDPCVEEGNGERVIRGGGLQIHSKKYDFPLYGEPPRDYYDPAERQSRNPEKREKDLGFRVALVHE